MHTCSASISSSNKPTSATKAAWQALASAPPASRRAPNRAVSCSACALASCCSAARAASIALHAAACWLWLSARVRRALSASAMDLAARRCTAALSSLRRDVSASASPFASAFSLTSSSE